MLMTRRLVFGLVPTFGVSALLFPALLSVLLGCAETARQAAPAPKAAEKHDDHADHDQGDHDHGADHAHPASLAESVAAVKTLVGSLEKAVQEGAVDRADDLVHEAGHLLEHAEELMDDAPEAVAKAATEAWDELSECLEGLDEKLHESNVDKDSLGKAYEAVKDRLKAAIGSLE